MLEELYAIAANSPEQAIRFVIIERGKRRKTRWLENELILAVDGNVLTRKTVLKAVMIAAGKMKYENIYPPSSKDETAFLAPLHTDAVQQDKLILVAEDNETNQKVIVRQLTLHGFAADIASDVLEALERWRSGKYPLVLTDLFMPKMNGYQLASAIRGEEKKVRHSIKTANTTKNDQRHCLEVGMDSYLGKPISLEKLKMMLNKWLPEIKPSAPYADNPMELSEKTIPSAVENTMSKLVDVSILAALVGDNPEIINDFLQDFQRSEPKIAMALKSAYATGEIAEVGELTHKLKSSSHSIGASGLGELCAAIEQAVESDRHEILAMLLSQFEKERQAVDNYLNHLQLSRKTKRE